jgi:hypothetical protein
MKADSEKTKEKPEFIGLYAPRHLKTRLQSLAKKNNRSLSKQVAFLITQGLKHRAGRLKSCDVSF